MGLRRKGQRKLHRSPSRQLKSLWPMVFLLPFFPLYTVQIQPGSKSNSDPRTIISRPGSLPSEHSPQKRHRAPCLKNNLWSYNSKSTVTTVLWPGHRTCQENTGKVSSQPSLSSLTFTALSKSQCLEIYRNHSIILFARVLCPLRGFKKARLLCL